MLNVPFDLPDIGLREISGRMYLDDEFLIFEVEDALAGEFDKDLQVIKISPSALAEVRFEEGVIRDRLYVRPKTTELMKAMPGQYGVEIPFKIWRRHRHKAEELVEELARRLDETTL